MCEDSAKQSINSTQTDTLKEIIQILKKEFPDTDIGVRELLSQIVKIQL